MSSREQSSASRAAGLRALADRIPDADEPLRASAWLGLAIGLLLLVLASCEAAATNGRPAERAVVVAVGDSENGRTCGARGGGRRTDVTWRSSDPPGGLPAEFIHLGACGDWRPGEETTLVRVPDGDAVEVHVEPVRSYAQAGRLAAAVALGVFIAGTVLLGIRLAALRLWARLRHRRRQRSDAS